MRKLTTTLCLTLAVLLGSVGVSWSADDKKISEDTLYEKFKFAEDRALDHAENVLYLNVGITEHYNGGKYVLSIGSGDTIVEAFCAALTDAAFYVYDFLEGESNSVPPTPSARMKRHMNHGDLRSRATIFDRINETSSYSGTLDSKFKIQGFQYEEVIGGNTSIMFEGSIKSPKANLNCFRFSSSTEGQQFNYEFKSEGMSFTKFLEDIRTAKYMKLFTEIKEKELAPGFAIIFASQVSRWQN